MNSTDKLHKAILNNVPDQAWLKDKESRYILVNDAFIAACGLAEHEILNRTPMEVWPEDWGKQYLETDNKVIRSGVRLRYEEWRYGKDGSLCWFDTIKTPIRNEHGEIIGTAGISRDISDRKQAEQELARLNRLYAVRSKTNQAIVRTSDRDQLFRRVCQVAVQAGGLALAWIGMFEDDPDRPVKVTRHFADSLRGRAKLVETKLDVQSDCDFLKTRLSSFQRFVCNAESSAKKFVTHARHAKSLGFSSFAVFPLMQGGQRVGIFTLYAAEENFFTDDIVRLLEALSADLSFALDFIFEAQQRRQVEQELLESRSELRRLSAYLQSVREEERTRISRELHDELGQSLTAIRIGLDVMETHREMQQDEWVKKVHSLKKIADSTVEAVQRIAADLRPSLLDELGLAAAIDWMLESFSAHAGIQYEALLPVTPLDFSPETSTAIFRILQESLTNVGRHSQASLVVIELKELDNMIMLKITDNGKGIDCSDGREKSLGLLGMRERAYMLGGKLTIQSRVGAGTSIELQVPKLPSSRENS